jgi:hypothetical protein
MTAPKDPDQDDRQQPDPTSRSRSQRIEQLLRRAVERGGYMTNADLIEAREVLAEQPAPSSA